MRAIQSNIDAFAALRDDGVVITWGSPLFGGDSSGARLCNVQSIYSNFHGFVALKLGGQLEYWGGPVASVCDTGLPDIHHFCIFTVLRFYVILWSLGSSSVLTGSSHPM